MGINALMFGMHFGFPAVILLIGFVTRRISRQNLKGALEMTCDALGDSERRGNNIENVRLRLAVSYVIIAIGVAWLFLGTYSYLT